ncbi:MAG: hypothetical protein HYU58_15920 [Proteobacteria bacterium]|nr:hypothetical protein [Pseudomonadota bacterium]
MSVRKFFTVAALALAAFGLFAAAPAEAKQPKKVKAPFALEQIDRNGDRDISSKEWNWAEKHGYDRVTRNGGSVSRKTYQAYVNRYYSYVDWRYDRYDDHDGRGWYGQNPGAVNAPWELGHR